MQTQSLGKQGKYSKHLKLHVFSDNVNDNSIVEPIILDLKSCYAVKYNLCCTSDNNLFSSLLKLNALHTGFTMMDRQDTDEEFELIG